MKAMYKNIIKMSVLLICLLNSIFVTGQYNANNAASYADTWSSPESDPTRHNPAYAYYSGQDCANFVSQCLIAGGLNLSAGTNGSGYGVNPYGCIPYCPNLFTHLKDYQNTTYLGENTNGGYLSGFTKGDVIIWWRASAGRWRHTGINAVAGTPAIDAHTSNRYHRAVSYFYPYFNKAGFFHFNSTTSNPPTITTPHYGDVYRFGDYVNVYVGGYSGNWSNIRVVYYILNGEPAFTNNSEACYNNQEMIANHDAGTNHFGFGQSTASIWNNKWCKIVAENTATGQKSTPQYIRIVPSGTNLIPTISSPSASVNCTSNNPSFHVGEQVTITLQSFTDILSDWNDRTEVIYAILSETPQCTQWDESIYQNSSVNNGNPCKFTAYQAGDGDVSDVASNTYFFTPETRSAWEGRWCKIIAHTQEGAWSEQRYIKIVPTLATITVNQGTLSPAFNANTTNYTVNVANSVSSITISATANSTATSISGAGTKTLSVGTNTYTVRVTGNNGAYTDYIVTVNRAQAETGPCLTIPNYDYSITPSTSWNTISNSILSQGCKIYRFSATTGTKYSFKTGCGDGATADFDTQLYLYNSSGNELTNNDDGCESNRSKIEDWECPSSGYYYLKVKGYNSNYGNYTLAHKKTDATVMYTITVSANPSTGGSVSGGGTYTSGMSHSVTATANSSYTFTNWTENGSQVSTSAIYTFTVSGNRTLVANFTQNSTCKTPPDYDLSFTPDETWNSKDWGARINSSNDCKVYRIYGISGATYNRVYVN